MGCLCSKPLDAADRVMENGAEGKPKAEKPGVVIAATAENDEKGVVADKVSAEVSSGDGEGQQDDKPPQDKSTRRGVDKVTADAGKPEKSGIDAIVSKPDEHSKVVDVTESTAAASAPSEATDITEGHDHEDTAGASAASTPPADETKGAAAEFDSSNCSGVLDDSADQQPAAADVKPAPAYGNATVATSTHTAADAMPPPTAEPSAVPCDLSAPSAGEAFPADAANIAKPSDSRGCGLEPESVLSVDAEPQASVDTSSSPAASGVADSLRPEVQQAVVAEGEAGASEAAPETPETTIAPEVVKCALFGPNVADPTDTGVEAAETIAEIMPSAATVAAAASEGVNAATVAAAASEDPATLSAPKAVGCAIFGYGPGATNAIAAREEASDAASETVPAEATATSEEPAALSAPEAVGCAIYGYAPGVTDAAGADAAAVEADSGDLATASTSGAPALGPAAPEEVKCAVFGSAVADAANAPEQALDINPQGAISVVPTPAHVPTPEASGRAIDGPGPAVADSVSTEGAESGAPAAAMSDVPSLQDVPAPKAIKCTVGGLSVVEVTSAGAAGTPTSAAASCSAAASTKDAVSPLSPRGPCESAVAVSPRGPCESAVADALGEASIGGATDPTRMPEPTATAPSRPRTPRGGPCVSAVADALGISSGGVESAIGASESSPERAASGSWGAPPPELLPREATLPAACAEVVSVKAMAADGVSSPRGVARRSSSGGGAATSADETVSLTAATSMPMADTAELGAGESAAQGRASAAPSLPQPTASARSSGGGAASKPVTASWLKTGISFAAIAAAAAVAAPEPASAPVSKKPPQRSSKGGAPPTALRQAPAGGSASATPADTALAIAIASTGSAASAALVTEQPDAVAVARLAVKDISPVATAAAAAIAAGAHAVREEVQQAAPAGLAVEQLQPPSQPGSANNSNTGSVGGSSGSASTRTSGGGAAAVPPWTRRSFAEIVALTSAAATNACQATATRPTGRSSGGAGPDSRKSGWWASSGGGAEQSGSGAPGSKSRPGSEGGATGLVGAQGQPAIIRTISGLTADALKLASTMATVSATGMSAFVAPGAASRGGAEEAKSESAAPSAAVAGQPAKSLSRQASGRSARGCPPAEGLAVVEPVEPAGKTRTSSGATQPAAGTSWADEVEAEEQHATAAGKTVGPVAPLPNASPEPAWPPPLPAVRRSWASVVKRITGEGMPEADPQPPVIDVTNPLQRSRGSPNVSYGGAPRPATPTPVEAAPAAKGNVAADGGEADLDDGGGWVEATRRRSKGRASPERLPRQRSQNRNGRVSTRGNGEGRSGGGGGFSSGGGANSRQNAVRRRQ